MASSDWRAFLATSRRTECDGGLHDTKLECPRAREQAAVVSVASNAATVNGGGELLLLLMVVVVAFTKVVHNKALRVTKAAHSRLTAAARSHQQRKEAATSPVGQQLDEEVAGRYTLVGPSQLRLLRCCRCQCRCKCYCRGAVDASAAASVTAGSDPTGWNHRASSPRAIRQCCSGAQSGIPSVQIRVAPATAPDS